MSRNRMLALAAFVALVAGLTAWWVFRSSVQRRVAEVTGREDVEVEEALDRVRIGAERALTPIRPGEAEHLCLRDVRAVLPTPTGVWVGTTDGLRRLQGERETVYTSRSGLLRSGVAAIVERGDSIVVVHPEGGLSVIRGTLVRTVARDDLVCTAAAGAADGVLIGTAEQGLLRWDGAALRGVPIAGGAEDDRWELIPKITSVAVDEAERVWVGTFDQGVALRDHEGWRLLGVADGLADPFVTAVATGVRDGEPAVLVGTQVGATLHHLDRTQHVGLHHEHVAAMAFGDEVMLVGTFGGGLSLYENDDWSPVTTPDLPSPHVQSVAADDRGRLWIGTRDGLVRRDDDGWQWMPGVGGPPGPKITAITSAASGGDPAIWVGTFERGVGRLQDGSWIAYGQEHGLPSLEINALTFHNGVLWVGTNAGAAWFSEGRFRDHPRLADLGPDAVTALLSDGDALWLATSRGVARLSGDGELTRLGVRDGLVNAHVYALGRSADALWAGTLGGISGLRPDGRAAPLDTPTVVAGPGGLSNNWVNAVITRGDEVLVGSYGGGVDRRHEGEWKHLFPAPGEELEINPGAGAWIGDRAVFGTLDRGLLVIDTETGNGRTLDAEIGLGAASVTAVYFDGEQAWVGTTAGIVTVPAEQILQ